MVDKNKIKTIIFDFDDTLYSGVDWTDYRNFCYDGLRKMFSELTDEEFKNFSQLKNGETFNDLVTRSLLEKYDSVEKWFEYRNLYECIMDYTDVLVVSNNVLQELKKNYKLYIVSNSIKKYILKACGILAIDTSCFEEILINKYDKLDSSKKVMYKKVLELEKIEPYELLVVGDSFKHDLQPALDLGANIKQVKTADFVVDDLFN